MKIYKTTEGGYVALLPALYIGKGAVLTAAAAVTAGAILVKKAVVSNKKKSNKEK